MPERSSNFAIILLALVVVAALGLQVKNRLFPSATNNSTSAVVLPETLVNTTETTVDDTALQPIPAAETVLRKQDTAVVLAGQSPLAVALPDRVVVGVVRSSDYVVRAYHPDTFEPLSEEQVLTSDVTAPAYLFSDGKDLFLLYYLAVDTGFQPFVKYFLADYTFIAAFPLGQPVSQPDSLHPLFTNGSLYLMQTALVPPQLTVTIYSLAGMLVSEQTVALTGTLVDGYVNSDSDYIIVSWQIDRLLFTKINRFSGQTQTYAMIPPIGFGVPEEFDRWNDYIIFRTTDTTGDTPGLWLMTDNLSTSYPVVPLPADRQSPTVQVTPTGVLLVSTLTSSTATVINQVDRYAATAQ